MTIAAHPGVGGPESHSATAVLARRGVGIAIGVVGVFAGLVGGVLVATSDHLIHPLAYGLQVAVVVVGTVGVGLYWVRRRPGNRIAVFLLAYAACIAGVALQGASNPLLHSIGVLFEAPSFLLTYYLILAFPLGSLHGVLEKALLAGVAWTLLVSFLPWFFFSPFVVGGAPLAGCTQSCPHNALMIADRPNIASGFGTTEEYLTVVLAASITLGLCYRLATSSRPRSRALLPVYVPALLLTVPFGVFHAARAGWLTLSATSFNTIGWFLTAGRIAFSFGFALAIWQAMLFAGLALRTILSRLGANDDASQLQALVADTLDDPPLEIAFELERDGIFFVDAVGVPIDPTRAGVGRSATGLQRHGDTIAYIVHDAALNTDPELVQAAGQAVLLALENGRLEAELQSKTAELQGSSRRIVAAGEAERRKLERELHDGAQQRLLTLQIKLAFLRDRVGEPELATELDNIEEDAIAASDELRNLAHGIYPVALREDGVAEALRGYVGSVPVQLRVVDNTIGRCDPAVEAAVYFCALEAIQNAVKHAGHRARVTVTLERRGDTVRFSIDDDGVGFDPGADGDGLGLISMRDRLTAFGGELHVISSPGVGTSVRGTVPVEVEPLGRADVI